MHISETADLLHFYWLANDLLLYGKKTEKTRGNKSYTNTSSS